MPRKPIPTLSGVFTPTETPAHLARDVIESALREAIMDGRIPPETPLRQEEIAALFGVSRMPVREALRRLESQGLLHIQPYKGAVVTALISQDAMDTYGVRLLLEPEALRLSLPHLSDTDLADASARLAALRKARDSATLARLNREFHMALYRRAGNARLLYLIEQELEQEERFLRFHLSAMGTGHQARDDHEALLDAARSGDESRALALLRRHLSQAEQAIRHYLSDQDNAESPAGDAPRTAGEPK